MSHFTVLVLTNEKKSVEKLLAPYDEDGTFFRAEQTAHRKAKGGGVRVVRRRPASRWDWWCVGGRWTGLFSDYDAGKDPRNWSVCNLCGGTGTRPDMIHGHLTSEPAVTPPGTIGNPATYKIVKTSPGRAADLKPHVNVWPGEKEPHVSAFMAVIASHVRFEAGWKGKPGAAWESYTTGCNGCDGSGASRNFGNIETPEAQDVLPVKEILAKYADGKHTTHAVVTPDGVWYENGEMGWFATVKDEKKPGKWHAEWLALLKKHKDMTATLVDAHV